MTTLHLSLSPFFARTVTALALFRTIAPHFVLLRDAFETLEDGLDSILKRSLRALSAPRTYQEESDNEEEEEMRLVKHSADSIAALRAMEYRRGRKALVKDKFAKTLAGKAAYAKAKRKLPIGDNGRIAIRTKFFDETIRMAMYENPTHVNWQIVLLGSGMDTRCYRMENPHGLIKTVFEIDHESVLKRKRELLKEWPHCGPRVILAEERVEVFADIMKDDWMRKLREKGFDHTRPTVWMLEGLLYYLTPEFASAVVRECADASARGSYIVASCVNNSSLYRAISNSSSAYNDLENQMTPMRDRLTYNNDDMSPLASSSYSPPYYLHTSGIDYSNDPHHRNEDKNSKKKKKTKDKKSKKNQMTARQTWKSAIDTPELYFPARGWERVTAYQLGDDGCDYGRWTGKRPTARPPTWKTDLEPRSFYVRAVKGGYTHQELAPKIPEKSSYVAFRDDSYSSKILRADFEEDFLDHNNNDDNNDNNKKEESFSFLDEDESGFVLTPSAITMRTPRTSYTKADIDKILAPDDEIDDDEARIKSVGQSAMADFEVKLNDVITEFD
jgi:methyltransferase (TIGR00027 family)